MAIVLRALLLGVSVLTIVWVVEVPWGAATSKARDALAAIYIRGERPLPGIAERFRPQCDRLGTQASLPQIAIVDMLILARDAEDAFAIGNARELDARLACARAAAKRLVATEPVSGFGWFALAWVAQAQGEPTDVVRTLLRRSVAMAPHEYWIARRRLPLVAAELLGGDIALGRSEYDVLLAGNDPAAAIHLLRICLGIDPFCEQIWNEDRDPDELKRIWRLMTRE